MPAHQPDSDPPEPDERAVIDAVSPDQIIADLLTLTRDFFQTHPTAREELRQFLANRGHHPQSGLGSFLDGLQFSASSRAETARWWHPPPANS